MKKRKSIMQMTAEERYEYFWKEKERVSRCSSFLYGFIFVQIILLGVRVHSVPVLIFGIVLLGLALYIVSFSAQVNNAADSQRAYNQSNRHCQRICDYVKKYAQKAKLPTFARVIIWSKVANYVIGTLGFFVIIWAGDFGNIPLAIVMAMLGLGYAFWLVWLMILLHILMNEAWEQAYFSGLD